MSYLSDLIQKAEGYGLLDIINYAVVPNEAELSAVLPEAGVAVSDLLNALQAAATKKSALLGATFAELNAMFGPQIQAELQTLVGEGLATLPHYITAATNVANALIAK